ncbi:hypothetical protein P0E66_13615 [Enterococcus faecalis]|uniref:hypothetical protein n=1 Tax=Enterococcus faecalis TaxID=1351 RepID=UPI0025B03100|nr:hypothetical protein [Enterococcus faecalis]MDN3202164.1 hypothetical protein [Enterococcus faecalis]
MLEILYLFVKRKYKNYTLCLFTFLSVIIAILLVIFQRVTSSPFVTIVVVLSCLLNSNKETDDFITLNKFKIFHLSNEHIFKLSLFLYLKRNKFFMLGLFYCILCLSNVSLFFENISLIIVTLTILLSNLYFNKMSEYSGEIHLIILIILITFGLGNYISIAMNSLFIFGLCMLLFPVSDYSKKTPTMVLKQRIVSSKVNPFFRYIILGNLKPNLWLLLFLIFPKVISIFQLKFLNTWAETISFSGIFSMLIIFELLQDLNLENHTIEYNKLKLYKLYKINFFKRMLFSKYLSIGVFVMLIVASLNLYQFKLALIQFVLVIMNICWYKFFEERALIGKSKPTWQLSFIRSWIPTTVLFLVSFAPHIINLLKGTKG